MRGKPALGPSMDHVLDRLTFFRSNVGSFAGGRGAVTAANRRWQPDRIVRPTHGVTPSPALRATPPGTPPPRNTFDSWLAERGSEDSIRTRRGVPSRGEAPTRLAGSDEGIRTPMTSRPRGGEEPRHVFLGPAVRERTAAAGSPP